MFKNKLPQLYRYTLSKLKYPTRNAPNLLLINSNTNVLLYRNLSSNMLIKPFCSAQNQTDNAKLSPNQYVEVEVAKIKDIEPGEMKEIQVGQTKNETILLVNHKGTYYAVGSKCTHFGAPLARGVLFENKVFCPWHCAVFNIQTGTPEMGPVWDGLPTYEVKIKDQSIWVIVPKAFSRSQTPVLSKKAENDSRKFVILGAGPSGLSAAQTLRQSGYTGEIVMITNENELPYDRTALSKNMFNVELKDIRLRDEAFFNEYDINIMKGVNLKSVNIDKDEIEIEGKDKLKYDKLLIATGARARLPSNIAGIELKNVFTLRNFTDITNIRQAIKQHNLKKVVIIGASFIGLETASNLKKELKDNVDIIVVDTMPTPLYHVLGQEVGNAIRKLHEKNGIKFIMSKSLKSLQGHEYVKSAQLNDDTMIDAEMVILGVGIQPNSDFVSKTLKLADDGSIYTDVFLKTSKNNIFAAGDVANIPYWYSGTRTRIEHYNEAIQQGSIAAFNMLDKKVPHDHIPFFWTRQWDMSIQYTGYAPEYDDVYIDGDLNSFKFVAYYSKSNQIMAVAAMNKGSVPIVINQAMELNVLSTTSELKDGKVTLEEINKRILSKKSACSCKKDICCKSDYSAVIKHRNQEE